VTERIVVSFWMAHSGLSPVTGRGYVERTRALVQRGEALGGNLIAFGSQLVALAFDPESLEEAVGMATAGVLDETKAGEIAWAAGVAQGAVEAVAPDDRRGWLAWGLPLAAGASLARVAHPGEVLVDRSLQSMSTLVTLGTRVARERGRRVRGAVLDLRQPWRHVAAALVTKLETPPLIGREDPSALLWMPGALAVLRADPGLGGSRLLAELASLVAPAPCLALVPSGSSTEPLGALRRALARARALEAPHFEVELEPALRRLLAGDGVPLETAAAIISSFLRGGATDAPPGALLIDDVVDVDPSSVEACARAIGAVDGAFVCVVRVDETTAPPPVLADLAKGPEMDLKPFDDADGCAFAAAVFGGALDSAAQKRWARRGSHTPLGIFEALAASLSAGELAWTAQGAHARTRVGGRGAPRAAVQWIARRAQMMGSALEQLVLAFVALGGGELSIDRLDKLLAAANVRAHAGDEAQKLVARRWLTEPQVGWIALPTRTHRDALLGELGDERLRGIIHRALAHVLESEERGLGLAEAAHHHAKAGDHRNAARIALTAARAAIGLDLRQAATHLIGFAREQDPSCDEEARAALALVVPVRPASTPDGASRSGAYAALVEGVEVADEPVEALSHRPELIASDRKPDSEPPTVTIVAPVDDDDDSPPSLTIAVPPPSSQTSPSGQTAPSSQAPSSELGTMMGVPGQASAATAAALAPTEHPPGAATDPAAGPPPEATTSEDVGERLTELAKAALLGADTQSLEQWAEGLLAAGEHGRFAERMQAIVRLARGDVGEALRALRAARAELDASAPPMERCQASLALGVALAVAGRPDEALLEALDALARAREQGDEKGGHACLAFLSKLFATVDRPEDATRLRRITRNLHEAPASPA
jgi:hypothetical protein